MQQIGNLFLNLTCEIRIINFRADVAELVDAQVSEACDGDIVMVRFHSSAFLFFKKTFRQI